MCTICCSRKYPYHSHKKTPPPSEFLLTFLDNSSFVLCCRRLSCSMIQTDQGQWNHMSYTGHSVRSVRLIVEVTWHVYTFVNVFKANKQKRDMCEAEAVRGVSKRQKRNVAREEIKKLLANCVGASSLIGSLLGVKEGFNHAQISGFHCWFESNFLA